MILKYQELNDKHAECKKIKKRKLWLLSPKEFDAYAKERKNRGLDTKVVRNTSLKKYNPDKNSNENEYIEIEGGKYRLKPEKKRKAKGYLFTGGNTFVRIEKSYAFFIPILLAIIAGIAIWFLLQGKGGGINPVTPDIDDNDIKDATQIMEEQPYDNIPRILNCRGKERGIRPSIKESERKYRIFRLHNYGDTTGKNSENLRHIRGCRCIRTGSSKII